MVNSHGAEKSFSCETCGKAFYLEWRLKKHAEVQDRGVHLCRYVKNAQFCPFEEIGCKFRHEKMRQHEQGVIEKCDKKLEESVEDKLDDDTNRSKNMNAIDCFRLNALKENLEPSNDANSEVFEDVIEGEFIDDDAVEASDDFTEKPHEEAMSDCDDEESDVCCYCWEWFDTRDSLRFHFRENHMAAMLSQFDPCYSNSL